MNNFRNLIISWTCQSRKFPLEYEIKVEIWELAKLRNIDWTKNIKIANFWSQTLNFYIEKILKFLNFPIWTFQKLQVWKIRENFNLGNSKNLQVGKFKKTQFGNFQKFVIWKIEKKFNFENSVNLQYRKLEKSAFSKILKKFQFQKASNF